ncbi:hypothetical protein MHK_010202 [Candidatus Magnetomorum sp. HK-1]|nr:hypothetical protein MHK_010202 [Candidatus Magnetomorum sp. HK-1]
MFALELKTFANNCSRANTRFAPTLALGIITFSLSLLEAGLLNKDLDKIVQTTGMDYSGIHSNLFN